MIPRALSMFSLHMGQVQCSFSQGSTQTLWKTCLKRQRDTFQQTRLRRYWGNSVLGFQTHLQGRIRTTSFSWYASIHTAQWLKSGSVSCIQNNTQWTHILQYIFSIHTKETVMFKWRLNRKLLNNYTLQKLISLFWVSVSDLIQYPLQRAAECCC